MILIPGSLRTYGSTSRKRTGLRKTLDGAHKGHGEQKMQDPTAISGRSQSYLYVQGMLPRSFPPNHRTSWSRESSRYGWTKRSER